MNGTEPSRAVAGSRTAGTDPSPTRSGAPPWAAARLGTTTAASIISARARQQWAMSPCYTKGARASSHCAVERHLCSLLRQRRACFFHFRPEHGHFSRDVSVAPNVLAFLVEGWSHPSAAGNGRG